MVGSESCVAGIKARSERNWQKIGLFDAYSPGRVMSLRPCFVCLEEESGVAWASRDSGIGRSGIGTMTSLAWQENAEEYRRDLAFGGLGDEPGN